MAKHDEVKPRSAGAEGRWTRLEDYLDLRRLRRRAAATLNRSMRPRSAAPLRHWAISTLPFMLLMAGLAGMALWIMVFVARGIGEPDPEAQPQPSEIGTAPPGWIDGPPEQPR
jgi:hypothetical protein